MSDTPTVPCERLMRRSILSWRSDKSGPDAKATAHEIHPPRSGMSNLRRPGIILLTIVCVTSNQGAEIGRQAAPRRTKNLRRDVTASPWGADSTDARESGRSRSSRCFLNGLCRGTDYVEHLVGVGEHRDVAALHLDGRGPHALRGEPFQVGMNRAILRGDDGPTRFRPPSDAVVLLREEIECRREVGRIDDGLLFGTQVAR